VNYELDAELAPATAALAAQAAEARAPVRGDWQAVREKAGWWPWEWTGSR
jgi:hypothetical protein